MKRTSIIVALGVSLAFLPVSSPILADSPPAFPDFKPKFVKPPKAGARKRVNVQINRPAPAVSAESAVAAAPVAKATRPKEGQYDWFWTKVSPDAAKSGPGRLEQAMTTLSGASKAVPAPRLQHMQDIAKVHGVNILRSTIGTKVSPALALAVISVESSGRSDAVSSAGAQGLMQLMPATASRFGVKDSSVPEQNIAGGIKYLDWLMGEFKNDPILVLAGYNAGEGSVRKYEGVPPYAETRDYVPKVLAAFQVAKGLCKTPPELISDGCVFAQMK
ncbi:lytic transglycosylase domain-containing protein [Sulfitobacter donghicola]|uniref:Lytic murein transglycosylase n=1 Tax=Sulfitobacter donghicola DSW-25 = KCTC 12864 = JCM 14565 TaxID=1300350 RepID=A0A073ID29_9RHOB|nr:lytic transglycosylase domain-containing protein [Sulfitobacter donghicola]KEJ88258.1 lytic murein transglycosylase [Sulfitobacter donghicola DSW-25 = KCTC 12864 = JCM 14565]KIN68853.1 Transglycosylase, Slt family [Sulfitobacter donghicola DSW-25 = KCTC 12864 = JCM 14565]